MFIEKAVKFYKTHGPALDKKTLMLKGVVFLGNRLFNMPYDKYYSHITNKLSNQFKEIIDSYKTVDVVYSKNNSKDIWMCWFQGKENMPPLVKRCYDLACTNFSDYNLHLITFDNYEDYVDVPDIILDKVDKGIISKTHFSDILRVKLLREYGGFWMDATLFSTSNKSLSKNCFTTFKMPIGGGGVKDVHDGRWSTFFLGGNKKYPLFAFLDDSLTSYFKKYNHVPDYLILDYFIRIAYQNFDYVKEVMDDVEFNNVNVYDLSKLFNSPFDNKIYDEFKSDNQFFKLTRKKKFLDSVNGKETFYKRLIIDDI